MQKDKKTRSLDNKKGPNKVSLVKKTDTVFTKKLLSLAIPIALQNLLNSSLSFVDTLMIGQIGSNQIAAVGVANQVFFLINLFLFGIASGASVFFSRYYGAKEFDRMAKVTALSITIAVIASFLWALLSFFKPEIIMNLFTDEASVVAEGSIYQKIVAISYVFFAVSLIMSMGIRSLGNGKIPLMVTTFSLCFNALFNYFLIFGIGPFPRMETAGAALATTISRGLEMLILIVIVYRMKMPFRITSKFDFRWNKEFLKSFTITSLPVVCAELFWALGMTCYKIAFSKLGVDALAAINVVDSASNFFFVVSMGIGNAATIMIGHVLGEGDKEKAILYSKRILIITFSFGILMGVLMATCAPIFISWFNISALISAMATTSMIVNSFYHPIKFLNMSFFVGVFRAGGDTKYAFTAEFLCVWLIGVPLAFLGALVFNFPIWAIYILVGFEEAAKSVIGIFRFRSGKWIKTLGE